LADILEKAELPKAPVLFQYFFPLTNRDFFPLRADAVICGQDSNGIPNVMGIEMKNWSTEKIIFYPGKTNKQVTLQYRGTGDCEGKMMPHLEAEEYGIRLKAITKGADPEINTQSIAYLPNIIKKTIYTSLIHNSDGNEHVTQPPNLYYGYDQQILVEKLKQNFSGGCGRKVAALFREARQKFIGVDSFGVPT
jgi:hypothetical protein